MIETELPEDSAGGMPDSILSLYSTDGNTKIAENEDDPRSSGSRASLPFAARVLLSAFAHGRAQASDVSERSAQ